MIRRRLVVGVTAVAALAIAIGSAFTLVTLRSRLVDNLDGQFRRGDLLEEVRLAIVRNRPLPTAGPRFDTVQRFAVLRYDTAGVLVTAVPSGPESQPDALPDADDLGPDDGLRTLDAVEGSLRYRAAAFRIQDGRVVVAFPMTTVDETMADAQRILVTTGLLAATTIAGLSWVVIRRAFAPIESMIGTADRIAAGDLTERTGVRDASEVGRLGGALDTMLDRIEDAVEAKTASEHRMRRFVAEASHELRTPLTSVRGYAELYRQGGDDPETVATSMARIEGEATRMTRLVEELLVLARLDQSPDSRSEPIELDRLIGDAVDAARVVDGDRHYDLALPPDPVRVTGDPDQLRRVVDNLVTNARIHTPTGTTVTVTLEEVDRRAVVTVRDDGPGIAPEERAQVFDRFWRSTRSDSNPVAGTGLGLAIVRSIVEAHGGTITVDAADPTGACFTMTLPAATTGD